MKCSKIRMKTLKEIQEEREELEQQEVNYHIKKLVVANKQADSLYRKELSSNQGIETWEVLLIIILAICLVISL